MFNKHADSRNNLNDFLHSNYNMFKSEKEIDHFKKLQNASDMYTQRQEQNRQARQNRHENYQSTTQANIAQQQDHNAEKSATEAAIKKLEEAEMAMLNKMQTTMAQKQQAIDQLKSKSKALQKNMEPRKAYKIGRGQSGTVRGQGSEDGNDGAENSANMTM